MINKVNKFKVLGKFELCPEIVVTKKPFRPFLKGLDWNLSPFVKARAWPHAGPD